MIRTLSATDTGVLCQKKIQFSFVLLLLGFFSFSLTQEISPALGQFFQRVQSKPFVVNGGGIRNIGHWAENASPNNIFDSKAFRENLIPPVLRDIIESSDDVEVFARTTLFTGVSDLCQSHLLELFSLLKESLSNGNLPPTWALQMVDAWGKFPSGILSGHAQVPGDFHECLEIRGNAPNTNNNNKESKETFNFKGKYCSTFLYPLTPNATTNSTRDLSGKPGNYYGSENEAGISEVRESVSPIELVQNSLGLNGGGINMLPFIGTCFPSSCSVGDVQTIFINFYDSNLTTSGNLFQEVVDCYTDEKPPFDAADIAVIILLSMIVLLCLVGSLFDILVYRKKPDAKNPSLMESILLAYSVPLNTEKLLSTNVGSDNLGCLHGLRFLSLAWVLLGHSWEMNGYQFSWNLIDMQNMYRDWTLLVVTNGTVGVDTFFTISGALMSYNLLRELEKTKGKFNYPLMVLHRYLRLTPTYMIVVGITATLLPYFAFGPQWYFVDGASKVCEKYWWYNALYINNLVDSDKLCYGPSWYLANDMQFFLVAPLIIYPLWRWKKVGFGILGAFSLASIVVPAVIQNVKKLTPTYIVFDDQKTFWMDLYVSPWIRMGPYVVGIFLGYILYNKSNNPRAFRSIPKWAVLLGWLLSTAAALFIVFGVKSFFDPANEHWTMTWIGSAFYAGLNRFVWGGVIAWIIFTCVSGYAGWVNRFLSWKVFIPLGRLTFCIYISSYHIQQLYHVTQTHPLHFSSYASVNLFFAHMVMTCVVGYVLTITLEAPFLQLEKLLIPSKRSQPKPKLDLPQTLNNNNNNI